MPSDPGSPHVCFLSPRLPTYLDDDAGSGAGGAERQVSFIAEHLRDRGWRVSIVARAVDGDRRRGRIDGFDVRRTIPPVRGIARSPYKAAVVAGTMARLDADVYYARANQLLTILGSHYCSAIDGAFVFAVARDSDVEPSHLARLNPVVRRLFVGSIRRADAVVAQTRRQRRVLAEEHGVDSTLIPNGYDVPPSTAVRDHRDRSFVLWVGRMDPHQKRPRRFLGLARRLPGHRFVMIGPPSEGDEQHYDEIEAEAEGISNLSFEGYVPPDAIDEYFRSAIALVNTSDYEGLPNTFLEAWRYATPVVSLYYSLDDKLDRLEIGCRSGSMTHLERDVRRLAEDEDRRRRLGTNGRRYLIDHHSLESCLEKYDRLFDRVLG